MDKQYLYILSHTTSPDNILKVGKTKGDPHIRAKALSKTVRGEHVVEWYIEVPDSKAAEKLAHLHLKKYHDEKEFFNIDLEEAVDILQKVTTEVFDLRDPFCFLGPRLREIARQGALKKPLVESLAQRARLLLLEQEAEKEAQQLLSDFQDDEDTDEIAGLTTLDRLDLFVDEVCERWHEKNKVSGVTTQKEAKDENEQYVMKLLSEKQGFNTVLLMHNDVPISTFGIKWCGYFWHLIMIQAKTPIKKSIQTHNTNDYEKIREFGRFVKEEYLSSDLYKDYIDKPIVFSVGFAYVKNHRPNINRCTLLDTEFINWYWSKLPKDKTGRIKTLVEETHSLR